VLQPSPPSSNSEPRQRRPSDGDFRLLADAYDEHAPAIFRYLLAKTGSVDRAEDLTQDVFLAALTAAPRLQLGQRTLLPWLYVVAARRHADDRRRSHREARCVSLDEAMSIAAPEPQLDPRAIALVTDGIRSLPPTQRRICLMRLFEGRPYAEIEEEVAATASACRMHLVRGLRKLRLALEEAGLGAMVLPLLCLEDAVVGLVM
jgi:RNA polymerase sigma factor (sigma-70 family)